MSEKLQIIANQKMTDFNWRLKGRLPTHDHYLPSVAHHNVVELGEIIEDHIIEVEVEATKLV